MNEYKGTIYVVVSSLNKIIKPFLLFSLRKVSNVDLKTVRIWSVRYNHLSQHYTFLTSLFTYQFRAHGVTPPKRQGVLDRDLPLHPFAHAAAIFGEPSRVYHTVEPPSSGVYADHYFVAVAVDLHVRCHFRGA